MSTNISVNSDKIVKNRFKIIIETRGSIYSKTLHDVRGNVLLGPSGNNLNVYSAEMKNEMDRGDLRLIHCIKRNYRYFVTSQSDIDLFQYHRNYGAPHQDYVYVVYPDEDFMASDLSRDCCAFFDMTDVLKIH